MQRHIHKYAPNQEYYFREGCDILELSNSPIDPQVSVARATVKPGISTRWHSLKETTERYVIQEGTGEVSVGDTLKETVNPSDVVIIPAGCRQRITNTGNSNLVFLAICNPRFLPENYQDLEDEPASRSSSSFGPISRKP